MSAEPTPAPSLAAAGTGDDPDMLPAADGSVPIKLLHDRVLVRFSESPGERRSGGGIVIPATAAVGRRLVWAVAVAVGPQVRAVQVGDRALFEPEEKAEVELRGIAYVMLRERDIHAVAAARIEDVEAGLYL